MAEILTLTTPRPALTHYRVTELHLNWTAESLSIGLTGPNGEPETHSYAGAAATALMQQLNKANLTTNSLHKRILAQLIVDGKLAGTISGSPD